MTRQFFLQRIIPSVYDSAEGAHAHDLAVLFAVKAMSELFKPTSGSPFAPQDYHELSYACLVAGKFYTETTTASLISLHLLANFFINSDDRKMVDAIFAIIGMAMRLAVIAGYHRDTPYQDLSREDLDQRRRIWFELLAVERVHVSYLYTPKILLISVFALATAWLNQPEPLRCVFPNGRSSRWLFRLQMASWAIHV